MSLPGTRVLSTQEEAALLLGYSALQRAEYLNEVWTNPQRGPAEAHELQRAIAEALSIPQTSRTS